MDLNPAGNIMHIQKVLKTYQSQSMDNLRGPSNLCSATTWRGDSKPSPSEMEECTRTYQRVMSEVKVEAPRSQHQRQQSAPIFIPMDTSSEKSETELEGHRIACFMVGGEKRLCLPQVLQTVLHGIPMSRVQDVCTDLHINFSRCNTEQLRCLKLSGGLPSSAPSCGLITKTDAERLVNKLLHSHPDEYLDPLPAHTFKVYHECFGKSKGVIIPELYTNPDSRCIKCSDCYGLFSPEKFVGHTHKALENRTCHWGFDPTNWRCYIHLAKDQDHKDSLQAYLEDLKSKFSRSYKRKECPSKERGPDGKKPRYYEVASNENGTSHTFRPWSPSSKLLTSILNEGKRSKDSEDNGDLPHYLHKGPPKLLNPERVIPFDDQKRYERHFAPNVSLAPVPPKKQKCKEYLAAAEAEEEKYRQRQRLESISSTVTHPSHHDDTDSISTASGVSPVSSRRPSSSQHPDEQVPPMRPVSSWRGQEVELFKQALDASSHATAQTKDILLQSFLRVCKLTDESVAGLTSAARDLQLEVVASGHREAQYREQLDAMQSAADTAAARHHDQQHQITEKYRGQLRDREAQYGEMHTEMLRELHRLRDELRKLGKNVPDIAYDFELMGDCPNIASPPDSPKTENGINAAAKAPEYNLVKIKEEKV